MAKLHKSQLRLCVQESWQQGYGCLAAESCNAGKLHGRGAARGSEPGELCLEQILMASALASETLESVLGIPSPHRLAGSYAKAVSEPVASLLDLPVLDALSGIDSS
mmetsp:Transcript_22412/g.40406  ORF Transcript_22412/g.40406 Transcript_22412/m.40406 type:complete len:107 (-) Transcript_22412:3180-3500(-)